MKPTERLRQTIAQQAKNEATPEELRGIFDTFPELGEDEARAVLEFREDDRPAEELAGAVASTVADLAATVDVDPRQLMDAAMGVLSEAVENSPAQQALTGDVILGELEQQAEDWAGDMDSWANEQDSGPEPLDTEADTAGAFSRSRDFGHHSKEK